MLSLYFLILQLYCEISFNSASNGSCCSIYQIRASRSIFFNYFRRGPWPSELPFYFSKNLSDRNIKTLHYCYHIFPIFPLVSPHNLFVPLNFDLHISKPYLFYFYFVLILLTILQRSSLSLHKSLLQQIV